MIQILRGLAALAVVFFHLWTSFPSAFPSPADGFARYGFLGVQLFFVISGYCISNAVLACGAAEFAGRRMIRIFPAYWAALLFAVWFRFFLGGTRFALPETFPSSAWYWLSQIFLVQGLGGQDYYVNVYWTLHIEIQFYAVMGILAFFRVLIPGAHFIALASLVWIFSPFAHAGLGKQLALTFWPQLYCGVLVFDLVSARKRRDRPRIVFDFFLLGMVLLTGAMMGKLQLIGAPVFAVILFLLLALRQDGFEKRIWVPLDWLGMISYSLYLIHNPIISFFSALRQHIPAFPGAAFVLAGSCFAVVLTAGFLLYKTVEEPALSWRRRRRPAGMTAVTDPAPP